MTLLTGLRGVSLVKRREISHADEPLNQRAWTLAERYLSPRLIDFTSTHLAWNCWHGHYPENDQFQPEPANGRLQYLCHPLPQERGTNRRSCRNEDLGDMGRHRAWIYSQSADPRRRQIASNCKLCCGVSANYWWQILCGSMEKTFDSWTSLAQPYFQHKLLHARQRFSKVKDPFSSLLERKSTSSNLVMGNLRWAYLSQGTHILRTGLEKRLRPTYVYHDWDTGFCCHSGHPHFSVWASHCRTHHCTGLALPGQMEHLPAFRSNF